MIFQIQDLNFVENKVLQQIKIKGKQLKIAQESNLIYVIEALEAELFNLQMLLSEPQDDELQSLMSLLDD